MKIYLDTIDTKSISKYSSAGLIDGVTTNPSIMSKANGRPIEVIKQIAQYIKTSISVEMLSITAEEMLEEAKPFIALGDHITIKLPMTFEGLLACRRLADQGIRVNMTLCFSVNQAILAAKAGAAYVSPFVGRMEDNGYDGIRLIAEIAEAFYNYPGFGTQILAASIRNTKQVEEIAKIGADVITVPPAILDTMLKHDLTDQGLAKFLSDWNSRSQ